MLLIFLSTYIRTYLCMYVHIDLHGYINVILARDIGDDGHSRGPANTFEIVLMDAVSNITNVFCNAI